MTSFYNEFGGAQSPQQPQTQQNDYGLMERINEFAKTVQNPQQKVQELLNSGKMTQAQFQQYAQMANMLMGKNGGHK